MDHSSDSEQLFVSVPTSEIVREQQRAPEQARLRATIASVGMALEPSAPASDLRVRIVASSRVGGRYGIFADRIARLFDLPLDAAREYLARIERPEEWGPGPMDGVAILPVTTGPLRADALATFTRFEPGVVFPFHAHVGGEVTLVVEGGFRDASGVEIWRGDELYKPPGSEHDFVVLSGGICIAAAVAIGGIDLR